MGTASTVTITEMLAMETAGFGESFEERIFFTGPSNTAEPVRLTRLQARKSAAGLMRAFVSRGLESEAHCERVATWSRRLARELGLQSERVLDVELGALLHDVGYISLDDIDFNKNSPLSYTELFDLRRHCEAGAALLGRIPALRRAIPAVLSHHEEFDGTGYPRGMGGVEIPIDGRIVHLVDAFESMTTDHAYRAKVSDADAREEIARCVGSRFDPVVFAAFSRIDPVEWRGLVASVG
jgi:HD-GYP domain-containing protein (c-di-GMP phosphodiesterase class II)